jgi:RNA polymerase sigma factor (sigma-70 family)
VIHSQENLTRLIQDCFRNPRDVSTLTRFDEFFRPFLMVILVSIAPVGSRLAEDAYQAAFVKFIEIFQAGRRPHTNTAYVSYFVTIAKNCLLDELRRTRRTVPFDDLIDENFPGIVFDDTDRRDARITVLKAIGSLPNQRCRYLLEQHYLRGANVQQVAKYLKIKDNSFYVVLQRCREELKNLILHC